MSALDGFLLGLLVGLVLRRPRARGRAFDVPGHALARAMRHDRAYRPTLTRTAPDGARTVVSSQGSYRPSHHDGPNR